VSDQSQQPTSNNPGDQQPPPPSGTSAPPPPQQPGWGAPPPGPPRKQPMNRNVRRNLIALGVIGGVIALLVIIGVALGGGSDSGTTPAASATSAGPATAEAAFIAKARTLELGNKDLAGSSDADLVAVGSSVCNAMGAGLTAGDVDAVTQGIVESDAHPTAAQARAFAEAAITTLCPQYANALTATTAAPATTAKPAPKLLTKTFTGHGNWNSPPFVLEADAVTVKFRYSGNTLGGSPSNFIASLESADDSLSIANEIASRGGKTTTLYPNSPGSRYHLEVTADGDWTVTIQERQ
jgi:Protein of unknown function (DUF732)